MTDKERSMQGSAQQAKELGFDPKENGEPLKSCKEKKMLCLI